MEVRQSVSDETDYQPRWLRSLLIWILGARPDLEAERTEDTTVVQLDSKVTFANWATTSYQETLAVQLSIAIDQLQTANNWSLTILIASAVAVSTNSGFPNEASLVLLGFLVAMAAHFSTRSLKGYINVVRWSTLQRSVIALATAQGCSNKRRDPANCAMPSRSTTPTGRYRFVDATFGSRGCWDLA